MHSRTDRTDRSRSAAASFAVSQRALDERTSVIAVEGELDLVTAPQLKWALLDSTQAGHNQLVVDLSRTTFMDSTALGVLIGVKRGLGANGHLTLVCDAPAILKVFASAHTGTTPVAPVLYPPSIRTDFAWACSLDSQGSVR